MRYDIGRVVLCGRVEIGMNVHATPGQTVLNQTKVGDRAYVGIGSVVIRRVQDGRKVFGNPATVIE